MPAAKSVNDVHDILSNALKWALEQILVSTLEPDGVIIFLTEKNGKTETHSTAECAHLFAAFIGHRLQPIVIVALQTGTLLGELLDLNWRHIDFKQKALTIEGSITSTKSRGTFVKDTKTNAGKRIITLSYLTYKTLRRLRVAQNKRNRQIQLRAASAVFFDSWI